MENLRNRKHKDKLIDQYSDNEKKSAQKEEIQVEKCKKRNGNTPSYLNNDEKEVSYSVKRAKFLRINFEIDLISVGLFLCGLLTRMYRLEEPKNIVFDELHYGKYVSLYMKNTFFFDSHPPLGKQLIAAVAYLAGFDGKFKFDKIGSPYPDTIPLFALRFVPAFFGSLIIPTSYHLMLELGLTQWTSLLAAVLLLLDNALLTQSRFILMESMLLFFALFGIFCILKFRQYYSNPYCIFWFLWLGLGFTSLTCALSVKYVGFYSFCLGVAILGRDFWKMLSSSTLTDRALLVRFVAQTAVAASVSFLIYLAVFYIHLKVLYKAGPHDSIMTSAFQASLEGGLASITKGQPLLVAHGSQITLRHTHGRTCWLHSHNHVYPIRYPDKRGSSHQQQVTCYSFKDVNNWWIVKRPNKNDLVVEQPIDAIKHGDVIQLVHGITSRALNSHDVAAPVSPQCQEVSCYIDYNVSMPAQNLWRVEILNRDQNGDSWHTIQSLIRLIHVDTNTALKFTGRQLPDWGFHQHEVAADRIINQDDTVWNVEEHRYTKSDDQKERERELVTAEMIPTAATSLTFWEKFFELHYKMLFSGTESVQNHMYSSEPLEWPLMARGIAYWVSSTSNAQIHLIGNLLLWYSGSAGLATYSTLLVFYLLRRRRQCYDLDTKKWEQFQLIGELFFTGYLFHYLPYFFVERTLFLHHYLPAFTFKTLLLAALLEHVYSTISDIFKIRVIKYIFILLIFLWICCIFYVFMKFIVLCYGTTPLTTNDIIDLRWKDTWDFIVHKN
ncbi:protein O-mannosyltransferase 1 [Tribolium castaneum]|uniref:Protein O-mannosyltransferase 1 n=1 Tax=Tribolium castaneum TaxID=7070 RepID=D6WKM8_TRICA|nr:PREDICTED: protein O-mannosyltransferase 1 [Tribolium castaneum]EFA03006.2 Protein O-mannosyltransferase 1-like Protein [Tribolium castaneum]|eukprot:XP_971065.1 PREDICTED: protein O-mannosyltransferase 1 [Tribolium castaneum]